MPTSEERREVARSLRSYFKSYRSPTWRELFGIVFGESERYNEHRLNILIDRLADLIDPDISSFYDADWRRWYEGLCHTDGDDSPRNLREVLEDIVWAVLTIDLGPNGNMDCGIDEGIVQTESLLDAWEREIREIIEPEPERTCHVVATERKVSQTQTMVSKSCSFCGHVFGSEEHRPFLPGAGDEIVLYEVSIPNYCPNCGAKVVGE